VDDLLKDGMSSVPFPGLTPLFPLRVALSWSNPKWTATHLSRLMRALKRAQTVFKQGWRRCLHPIPIVSRKNSPTSSARPETVASINPLCPILTSHSPNGTLYIKLHHFTPLGHSGLRAAFAFSSISSILHAAFLDGSVTLAPIYHTESMGAYLGELGKTHLALDVLPFSAGVTLQDLSSMRIPLLTLAALLDVGDVVHSTPQASGPYYTGTTSPILWRSALGGNILTKLGATGLVALGEVEWGNKFAELACDPWLREAWSFKIDIWGGGGKLSKRLTTEEESKAYGESFVIATNLLQT